MVRKNARVERPCSFSGCTNIFWAKDLCGTHYQQYRAGKPLTPINGRLKHEITRSFQPINEKGEKWYRDCERFRPGTNFIRTRKICNQCSELLSVYRLSFKRYTEILESQGGCAGGCGRYIEDSGNFLSVDHDHSCCSGKKSCGQCIRGILCINCNSALGMVGDNIQVLENLINYLLKVV